MKRVLTLLILLYSIGVQAQSITTSPMQIAADSAAYVLGGGFPTLKWFPGDKTLNPKGTYQEVAIFDSVSRKIKAGRVNWHHLGGLGIIRDSDTSVFARKAAMNLHLPIADTSSMLSPYASKYALNVFSGALMEVSEATQDLENNKLNKSDTASMLSPYLRKSTADATYLQTEVDPTVPSYAKSLSAFSVIKTSADAIYKPIGYTPAWVDVIGKPTFATVATSGSYNDLSNKPTIPSSQVQTDWNAITGIGVLLNKPTLSTVATSGSYVDLSNKPTIPSAQVNTDWNSVSGVSQLLNKPTLSTVATTGAYNDLSGKPTIPAAQVNADWNSDSGVSQILNKPTIRRIETYEGTTNGSGNYTVTFGTAFATKPKIAVSMLTSNNRYNAIVTAVSTTGFTVQVTQYTTLTVLSLEVLAGAPSPVNGAGVSVIVCE